MPTRIPTLQEVYAMQKKEMTFDELKAQHPELEKELYPDLVTDREELIYTLLPSGVLVGDQEDGPGGHSIILKDGYVYFEERGWKTEDDRKLEKYEVNKILDQM